MKKLLALLLALSMLTALTACGKKNDAEQETEQPSVENTAPETEDTTTEPETETETQPEEDTSAPEQETEDAPAAGEGVDLNAFYESIATANGENWPAMMPLDAEMMEGFYPGLSAISTKSCAVYMPMMSSVVCEIALVEVENEADVQAVKDIFQARIDYQVGDDTNPGGAWYPESIEGWKNNSRIASNGNCVLMVAFSECDAVVEMFNAL